MPKPDVDAEALTGYIQGKIDSNKKIMDEAFKRLGQLVMMNKSTLITADFSSPEYRNIIDRIIDECQLLHSCHTCFEAFMILAKQFKLEMK